MSKAWRNLVGAALLASVAALTIFTISVVSPVQLSGTVKIDGSSSVYPLTEAVAEEFQKRNPRVKVTVGISGTGGGFKKFARGETDISNASRPIRPVEDEECRKGNIAYIELPVAYDALAVVVNPANNWCDYLTVEELKRIWEPEAQGKVNNWSQVRSGFPNRPLRLFGAGADSGTYDFFTAAIVGKERASRGDYTGSEDDNVLVQGVASDPNALGFIPFAYYAENRNRLKAIAIQCQCHNDNKPMLPSEKAVIEDRYHLARPLFIYVNREAADRPEVRSFVEFYLQNAAKLAKEVGYVPLPKRAYDLAMERFRKRIVGSMFGAKGSQVGLSIEELLAAEAKKTQ
ncbi:MAG: PstS family phosphate ABC transporter substrate-binding protein [Armatimonadetes bacterium]|nr:PstS family phosphate ABC transporter substrate-binding protein [Armatimonadota bacterium]MDW8028338.1 PstS family phosphate ABC transporter substrate-binding protein [Armatimonadota bacterium]